MDLGKILQAKGAIRLKQLNPEINPEDLSPMSALKYIETGVKIERQILGEPDQVIKHTGSLQVQAEWVTRKEAEQRQASERLAPTNEKCSFTNEKALVTNEADQDKTKM